MYQTAIEVISNLFDLNSGKPADLLYNYGSTREAPSPTQIATDLSAENAWQQLLTALSYSPGRCKDPSSKKHSYSDGYC